MTSIAGMMPRDKTPCDPQAADEFDTALATVNAKYPLGIPLTRGELLRLAKAALALIGGEK